MTVYRDMLTFEAKREMEDGFEIARRWGSGDGREHKLSCPAVISHAGDTNSLARSDVAPHCGSN